MNKDVQVATTNAASNYQKQVDEYANKKSHKSGTIPRERFNRRTLIEDVEKWGEYITG